MPRRRKEPSPWAHKAEYTREEAVELPKKYEVVIVVTIPKVELTHTMMNMQGVGGLVSSRSGRLTILPGRDENKW